MNTVEFQILWDADWLVNFSEMYDKVENHKKMELIEKVFKTDKGKELAIKLYVDNLN